MRSDGNDNTAWIRRRHPVDQTIIVEVRQHGIIEHSRHTLNDVTTLAEILRGHGWFTAAEMTGPLIPESGLGRGFDEYHHRDRSEYLRAAPGQAGRQVCGQPAL